jgi:polysaccharide export outer membrane protein
MRMRSRAVGIEGPALIAAVMALALMGCGTGHVRSAPALEQAASDEAAKGEAANDDAVMTKQDRQALAAVARGRNGGSSADEYRIGPDDLLDIRIPDLLDAQAPATGAPPAANGAAGAPVAGAPAFQQGARVNSAGDVSIPMLGLVHAGGSTTTALEAEIARRLTRAGILRRPQVSVQIVEYRSGVVAVVGSVERPGLYPVTRPHASIADLIWAAGGPSKDAGRIVEFAPTESRAATAAAPAGAHAAAHDGAARRAKSASRVPPADPTGGAPLRLDLGLLTRAAGATALNPEVRPGDVISVAPAGSVLVDGWVERPGSYPVTRGLTVSGAIAAAGGHVFAADRHHATVTRTLGGGAQRSFTVDLEALAAGQAADVPISDGDVVHVPASPSRVVPWGMWAVAREMVHIGGNVLLF